MNYSIWEIARELFFLKKKKPLRGRFFPKKIIYFWLCWVLVVTLKIFLGERGLCDFPHADLVASQHVGS